MEGPRAGDGGGVELQAAAAAESFYGLSLVTETGEAITDMNRRKATWGYLL